MKKNITIEERHEDEGVATEWCGIGIGMRNVVQFVIVLMVCYVFKKAKMKI